MRAHWPKATVLAAAFFLLLQAPAQARPPVLNDLQFTGGVLSASWSLPPGVEAVFFETSLKPDQEADGGFEQLDILKDLAPGATTISISERQPPGLHYVHIVGNDNDCDGCPAFEYSEIRTALVTYGFRGDANTTCKAYIPAVNDFADRFGRARNPRRLARLLDQFAALTDELVADLRDNPSQPAAGSKAASRFRAMQRQLKRFAGFFRQAARNLRKGRRNAAVAALDKAAAPEARAHRFAKQLKLSQCARLI